MSLNVTNLKTLFVAQLKDAYSAESQIIDALPDMIDAAQSDELRKGLQNHLEETKGQRDRIVQIFNALDYKPGGERCAATAGLIEEADELVKEHTKDPAAVDAAIICACQKIEHYEIATYGCLIAYAEQLGMTEAAKLLTETIEQERNADKTLTKAAFDFANAQAMSA